MCKNRKERIGRGGKGRGEKTGRVKEAMIAQRFGNLYQNGRKRIECANEAAVDK